mmetsp:Transcript_43196/g.97631  ORF Transcript_43196/g.97631 Transcript_43196/m.97631 type:complete len:87 (-) Transcript_43196:333-593(-)
MRWESASALLQLGDQVAASAPPEFPLLVIHDPKDQITSAERSREFFDSGTSPKNKYVELRGGLHDLFANEGKTIAGMIIKWVEGLE